MHAYTYIHTNTPTHTPACIHEYTYTPTHIYTHTYNTHTYTHIPTYPPTRIYILVYISWRPRLGYTSRELWSRRVIHNTCMRAESSGAHNIRTYTYIQTHMYPLTHLYIEVYMHITRTHKHVYTYTPTCAYRS